MTLFRVLSIFLTLFSFICLMLFARDITKGTIISVYLKYNDDNVGRDSSVGIATRYGLDGQGIESRGGGRRARFSAPVLTGRGAYPASYTTTTGSFPGVQRPGCGVDRPPPSSTHVKERVELYLYSTSEPSWSVLG